MRFQCSVLQRNVHGRHVHAAKHGVPHGRELVHDQRRMLLQALFRRTLSTRFFVLHPDQRCVLSRLTMLLWNVHHRLGQSDWDVRRASDGTDVLFRWGRRHGVRVLRRLLQSAVHSLRCDGRLRLSAGERLPCQR